MHPEKVAVHGVCGHVWLYHEGSVDGRWQLQERMARGVRWRETTSQSLAWKEPARTFTIACCKDNVDRKKRC